MSGSFWTSAAMARVKSRALGSTALSALTVLAAQMAWAAPPAPNSLPGSFSSNVAPTYTGSGATATITTVGGNNVLQWGGTALGTKVTAPSKLSATNTGFSIGSAATLTIDGAATSVLVTDQTGSPSQIFGSLSAGTLRWPALRIEHQRGDCRPHRLSSLLRKRGRSPRLRRRRHRLWRDRHSDGHRCNGGGRDRHDNERRFDYQWSAARREQRHRQCRGRIGYCSERCGGRICIYHRCRKRGAYTNDSVG